MACGSLLLSHLPRPPLHFTVRSLFPFPQDTEHCREIIIIIKLPIVISLRGEASYLPGRLLHLHQSSSSDHLCGLTDRFSGSFALTQKTKVLIPRWNVVFFQRKDCTDLLAYTMVYRTFPAVNKYTWLQSPTIHSGQRPGLQLLEACGFVLLSHLPLPPLHLTLRSIFPFPQDTEHWGKELHCHFSWAGIQYKFLGCSKQFYHTTNKFAWTNIPPEGGGGE